MHHRNMNANGVKHMNTRENVGGGICRVEIIHQLRTKILVRVHHGPQIRPVWENGTDQQADGHACKQVSAEPVIILLAGKEKVQDGSGHIGEPQQVWDDKIFIKRNQIIQPRMKHIIISCHGLFQIQEPRKIDKRV